MKALGHLLKSAAALLAVTALVTTVSAANPGDLNGSATIYKLSGSATVNGSPAYVGQVVSEGATIVTGAGSTTEIDLGLNGGLLSIKPNSTISLDKLALKSGGVAETFLDLKEGKVTGNVKKISAASKYEIKTAKGVAGIRGTAFALGADGTAHVVNGTVVIVFVINGVASPPVTVSAGQSVSPPTTPGALPTVVPTTVSVGALPTITIETKDTTTTTPPPVITLDVPKPYSEEGVKMHYED